MGSVSPRQMVYWSHNVVHTKRFTQSGWGGLGLRVYGSGFRVQGLQFRVHVSGFTVYGSDCEVQGAGRRTVLRVQGSG